MEHGMYVSKQQALCHVKKTKKKKTYPSLQTKNVQVLFEANIICSRERLVDSRCGS